MMGWSPKCYIPSFVEIDKPVAKTNLKGFTIYGRGGHLGHVTSIMSSDFHFLVPKSFHKNLVQIGTVVSEKIWFEFLHVHDLGPRSRNDLDFQYSHTFIYSICPTHSIVVYNLHVHVHADIPNVVTTVSRPTGF